MRVLIIGAGPAGITAGYELKKRAPETDVTIFEENGKVGGISKTVKYKGNRMDIGGHRFFSKDTRVTDWWESIMKTQGAPAYDYKVLGRDSTVVQRTGSGKRGPGHAHKEQSIPHLLSK